MWFPLRLLLTLGALLLAASGLFSFEAAAYATRPIHLIVPFPPGGTSDTIARLLARELGAKLSQSVVVENRAGAGTIIGTDAVAKSPPDGHTLLLATNSLAINFSLYGKVPYTADDLRPVITVATSGLVLMVDADAPTRSLAELLEAARAKKGDHVTYGSAGNGSVGHLTTEMLKTAAGFEASHIPYRGSAASLLDLVAGRTTMAFDTLFFGAPQVKAGALRALCVSRAERSPLLPDVPTVTELGYPGFEASAWFMLAAPAGTPTDIVKTLNDTVEQILGQPETRKFLEEQGADPAGGSVEETTRFFRSELAKWTDVVKRSGARVE